jgi:UDP-GlcNAc:undecaprenyl-phosphate GlcNAc-1-phosphate transferase
VVNLLAASTTASALTWAAVSLTMPGAMSVSVAVLDWMLTTLTVGAVRFGFRALRQYMASHRRTGRRVLVYGTGSESLLAVRHLRQSLDLERTPVGFVTRETAQRGMLLQGLAVLGTVDDLPALAEELGLDEVIIPAAEVDAAQQEAICVRCHEAGITCHHFSLRLQPAPLPPERGDAGRSSHVPELGPSVSKA